MRQQVKWDLSKCSFGEEGLVGCPQCAFEKPNQQRKSVDFGISSCSPSQTFAIHPETVALLCDKHYKKFRMWHDREVKKGNIKSWFR